MAKELYITKMESDKILRYYRADLPGSERGLSIQVQDQLEVHCTGHRV